MAVGARHLVVQLVDVAGDLTDRLDGPLIGSSVGHTVLDHGEDDQGVLGTQHRRNVELIAADLQTDLTQLVAQEWIL